MKYNRVKKLSCSVMVAVAAWICFAALPAHAQVTLNYSQFSSDSTPASVLDAVVEFTVSGSQLTIDIDNDSAYKVAQLYFNSDTTLTGLAFNPAGATNSAWSISGTGTTQTLGADGMGSYNWLIDFGSGADRLAAGSLTTLVLDMTGTTSEATIGTKLSTNPPGSTQALSVLKFEAGPDGDSAFGGSNTTTTPPVPEPGSMALLATGTLGLLRVTRRRKQAA